MITASVWLLCGWAISNHGNPNEPFLLTAARIVCAVGAAVLVSIHINQG